MSEWQPLSGEGSASAGRGEGPKDGSSSGKAVTVVVVGAIGCFVLIVVIGILAAIAIPNFLAYQLRAKRTEASSTLDGIRTAELAYLTEFGEILPLGPCPATPPGRAPRPWGSSCLQDFDRLGFVPFSEPRCTYEVTASDGEDFAASARCDVDGDGEESSWSAGGQEGAQRVTPANVY